MKQTLLLLLFSFIAFGLQAQVSFVESEMQVDFVAEGNFDEKTILDITNSGSEDDTFVWQVTRLEGTNDWNFYVCDYNKCYGPGENTTDIANTIIAGETRDIQFHIMPNSIAASGVYQVELLNPDNLEEVLSTVVMTFNGTLVSNKEELISDLAVYPNPVADYFNLDNPENIASTVILYDLLGKEVKSFDARSSDDFFVGDLSEGRYFARIFDENGKSLKVLKLVKKYSRP